MRKLVLSALLLSVFPLVSLGAVEGQWTYIVENSGATITASTATGAVTIPSVLGVYDVKKLGAGSASIFRDYNTSVTSVVIPNSVTSIGVGAFGQCFSLTSVTIPESVTNIGSFAFFSCTSLASIIIPNNVTSIGSYAFYDCTGLTSVIIGSGVTSIESHAFYGCTGLTSVTFAPTSSVTTIGGAAFFNCTSLTSVTIPYSVTSIGDNAFKGCTSLASIIIPNNVTSIGNGAFHSCTSLQRVYLPVRFEGTYSLFGLTSAQVLLYDEPSNPFYLAGQQSVIANPSTYSLYTATQYTDNYAAGQQNVISNPNTHNLYTTSQIHYMAMGDLVLTRQEDGIFVLNYDIDQSTDLQNWTPYVSCHLPLEYLPEDKAFVRIKMLNLTPYPPIAAPTPPRDPSATPIGSNF